MKRIMKVVASAACVGAMLCFAGCGAKGPDAVALDFMQKLSSGQANLEYLSKNCTENTAKLFSMFGDEAAKEIKGATFKVINTEIKGDKAVVSIEQTHADKKAVNKIDLVKVDGTWRVDVNKEEDGSNEKAIADACVNNMKQIQCAFEQALMAGKTVKSVSDLCGANGLFKVEPRCPLGGTYKIDKDFNITCSSGKKGHSLSDKTEDKDGRANEKAIADACVSNMKQIQVAIEQALMSGKTVKSVSDLCGVNGYFKAEPKCPLGGTYRIDKDFIITCSSHSLSDKTEDKDGRANEKAIADACVNNMKQIRTAWEQMLMAGKTVKSVSELCGENGLFKVEPKCPLGGKYQIDEKGDVTCSSGKEGHVLSF